MEYLVFSAFNWIKVEKDLQNIVFALHLDNLFKFHWKWALSESEAEREARHPSINNNKYV